jgi:hypothetical protein
MRESARMAGPRGTGTFDELDCFPGAHQIFARCSLDGIGAWATKIRVIDFPGFWLRRFAARLSPF